MNISRREFLIFSLGITFLFIFTFDNLQAQTIQDLSCKACIIISDTKTLEIHKSLPLPLILWAENFDYVYDHNSVITLNGISKLNNPETPITVSVTDPIGNLVTIKQINVPQNSNFQIKFNTGGPLWKKDGMYIIKAQAGPESTVFKTTVDVISTGIGSKAECKTKEITVMADNGGRYCIPYTTTGNIKSIDTATLNTNSKSLKIVVRSLDIQKIILEIDKTLIDSKTSKGENIPFDIFLNGKFIEIEEEESILPNYRKIPIPIPRETVTIEIVGTHAIPEFGSMAVLILIVTVIAVVIFSRKRFQSQMIFNN